MSDSPTLKDQLSADPTRSTVIEDCQKLVDAEVAAKRGMSGAAIKLGYKTVKAIKPGFVRNVINNLLDDWLEQLEPFHAGWRNGGGSFAEYVTARSDEVAEAMLSVTDSAAAETKHKTAAKMYRKMRPSAKDNVVAALPKLGAVMEQHLQPAG